MYILELCLQKNCATTIDLFTLEFVVHFIVCRVRQMLGNLEEIRDYHSKVMLPRLERAVGDPQLMRYVFFKGKSDIIGNLCRILFETEQLRLSRKYGRYCVNSTRSSIIIDQNIKFFSLFQFSSGHQLRVDAMLIKPIQRLTR